MHEVDYLCGVELGIGDILGGLVSSESGPASNPGYVPRAYGGPLLPSSAPHQLPLSSRTASKLLNPVEHQQPFWKAIATAGRNSGCCGVPPLPMLRLNVAAVIAGSGGFWRVDRHRGGGGRHSTPPGQVRVLRSPVPCLLRSPQGFTAACGPVLVCRRAAPGRHQRGSPCGWRWTGRTSLRTRWLVARLGAVGTWWAGCQLMG